MIGSKLLRLPAVLAAAVLATLPTARADAAGPHIETTRHGVVTSSTLRHCANEDGSGSHVRRDGPCTWNVGTETDGNGRGLAYVVQVAPGHRHAFTFDYVWNHNPARHGWRWASRTSDCVVKPGRDVERCPSGTYPATTSRES